MLIFLGIFQSNGKLTNTWFFIMYMICKIFSHFVGYLFTFLLVSAMI
jgi:hypothetical protein